MEEAAPALGALEDVAATEQQQAHGSTEIVASPAEQEPLQTVPTAHAEDDGESGSTGAAEAALQPSAAARDSAGALAPEEEDHMTAEAAAKAMAADAEPGMQGSAVDVGGTSPALQTAATTAAAPAPEAAQEVAEEQESELLAIEGRNALEEDAGVAEAESSSPISPAQQLKRAASKEDQHEMAALRAEVHMLNALS